MLQSPPPSRPPREPKGRWAPLLRLDTTAPQPLGFKTTHTALLGSHPLRWAKELGIGEEQMKNVHIPDINFPTIFDNFSANFLQFFHWPPIIPRPYYFWPFAVEWCVDNFFCESVFFCDLVRYEKKYDLMVPLIHTKAWSNGLFLAILGHYPPYLPLSVTDLKQPKTGFQPHVYHSHIFYVYFIFPHEPVHFSGHFGPYRKISGPFWISQSAIFEPLFWTLLVILGSYRPRFGLLAVFGCKMTAYGK